MAQTVVAASLTLDASQATQSVGSFRQQLRNAQNELVNISEEFGETSAQALAAARGVASLRDRIQDAREVTELFDPARRFQVFGNVLQTVVGGVSALTGAMALFGDESEEVQKTLVKVQGALALSQGVSTILNAGEDFQRLGAVAVSTFKQIRTAIGTTGIGLIVVAVGLLVTYFDDIKEALTGINSEEKKLLETSTKLLAKEQERLGHIDDADNILKQQGKTEKQILELKEKQTAEVIKTAELSLQQQINIEESQIAAIKRNHDILFGLIELTTIPLQLLTRSVDAILQKVGVNSGLTNLINKGVTAATNLIFDPVATKKKADEDIQTSKDALTKLKNTYAGYQLQIKAIDKEALEKHRAFLAEIRDLDNQAANATITDADILAERKLKQDHERDTLAAQQEKLTKSDRAEKLLAIDTLYYAQLNALVDKGLKDTTDKLKAAQVERDESKKKSDAEGLANFLNSGKANLQAVIDLNDEIANNNLDAAGQKYASDLAALNDWYAKKLELAKGNAEAEAALTKEYERQKTAITEIENQARLSIIGSVLGQAADLFGRATVAGKALAIAQTTIDTYQSATASYKSLAGIPIVGPALGFAAAAVAVAAGLANVKRILSTQVPGQSSGATGVPSVSASAPLQLTPQVTNTQLPQDQINQIGNATVRAFVVESDISKSQQRVEQLNRAARLGG